MKNCPTSNMNSSKFWGFEVSQIFASFGVLIISNVALNAIRQPLLLSWALAGLFLLALRIISVGQKNGHLELLSYYLLMPHLYLGHAERGLNAKKL